MPSDYDYPLRPKQLSQLQSLIGEQPGKPVVSTATFQMNGTSSSVTNPIAEVDVATNPVQSRYTPPAGFAYNSAVFSLLS